MIWLVVIGVMVLFAAFMVVLTIVVRNRSADHKCNCPQCRQFQPCPRCPTTGSMVPYYIIGFKTTNPDGGIGALEYTSTGNFVISPITDDTQTWYVIPNPVTGGYSLQSVSTGQYITVTNGYTLSLSSQLVTATSFRSYNYKFSFHNGNVFGIQAQNGANLTVTNIDNMVIMMSGHNPQSNWSFQPASLYPEST